MKKLPKELHKKADMINDLTNCAEEMSDAADFPLAILAVAKNDLNKESFKRFKKVFLKVRNTLIDLAEYITKEMIKEEEAIEKAYGDDIWKRIQKEKEAQCRD